MSDHRPSFHASSIDDLFDRAEFTRRHIGPTVDEQELMLAVVGASSIEELLSQTVPSSIRSTEALALPGSRRAEDVLDELRSIAGRNAVRTSLIGMGYYGTATPPVVQRNLLENPAWYTAYTPYQPEISQGRLEALLNFQTMVADLTGLDIANASLLDEVDTDWLGPCVQHSDRLRVRVVVHDEPVALGA
jgi:glycine dehydrogenase